MSKHGYRSQERVHGREVLVATVGLWQTWSQRTVTCHRHLLDRVPVMTFMAHFHRWRQIWIWIPTPIITLYYAELFQLAQIQIWIPV